MLMLSSALVFAQASRLGPSPLEKGLALAQ